MIPLTKDRLDEARFFLGHLHNERRKHAHPNKPPSAHFRFYLHAFIGAACSIRWVLQSEEKEKYEAWKPFWEARISEAEKPLLKLTTAMRNSAVKEGHIETTSRSQKVVIPIEPDPYQLHTHRAYLLQLRQAGGPWTIREDHFVELDGKEQEVTTVCEQYVEFLEKLVTDFEKSNSDTG